MVCKNKGCAREIDADSVYCKWCGTRQVREKKTKAAAPAARQLPSGAWTCRVRVGGRDISVTRPTKAEAQAEAMAVKHGLKAPDTPRVTMTLEDAYKAYIESRDGVISPSTVAGYKRMQKSTFQPLMSMPLSSITSTLIQREVSAMARSGKSPKYIANAEGLLSSVLKQFNPGVRYDVHLPPKRKPDLRQPDDAEISAILSAFRGSPIELPVLMALWMGMRMSEILGARYEDIEGSRLHIRRALVLDVDGHRVVKDGAKTYAGDRWVSIPDYIMALIRAQGRTEGPFVTVTGDAVYKRFIKTLERAGIPRCRFHDLRHANAAVMVRLGVDSKYAQERNGWASDRMYKQTYAYVMADQMDEVDKSIDGYFVNKMTTQNQKTTE